MLEKENIEDINGRDILRSIMNPQNRQQLEAYYDELAKDYERVSVELFGRGKLEDEPLIEKIVKYVPKNACILDAGVGTGIVGQQLYQLGYHNIVGIDFAKEMLVEAEKKNVYNSLRQMVLG